MAGQAAEEAERSDNAAPWLDDVAAARPDDDAATRTDAEAAARIDSTDLNAVDMAVKRIKEYPGTWSCIGEIMSRHDDLTNLTTGARPRADHPALFRVFDFAGEQGIPVLIHHNVAPISPSGAPKDPLYLPELLNVLEEFQRTKIIWAHAGISRRIVVEDLVGLLDELLAAHKDHLYLDLSWVTFERYILKDLNGWTTLISKYPDNFMIGSDAVGRLDSALAKGSGGAKPRRAGASHRHRLGDRIVTPW